MVAYIVTPTPNTICGLIESAHAIAHAMRVAKELGPQATVLVNLSGRGDKDVEIVASLRG